MAVQYGFTLLPTRSRRKPVVHQVPKQKPAAYKPSL